MKKITPKVIIASIGVLVFVFTVNSCKTDVLKEGLWKGQLDIGEGRTIPFQMDFNETRVYLDVSINNANEVIQLDTKRYGDSIVMKFPVFDSEIRSKVLKNGSLEGYWYNYAREDYRLPFSAHPMKEPSGIAVTPVHITGKWEVHFGEGTEEEWPAIGLFNQAGNMLTGTFLTETGDYRYLQGKLKLNKINLSCFDGAHAFLFTGKASHDFIEDGKFYSGNHYQADWIAYRNEDVALSDPNELTRIVEGEDFHFQFPDKDFGKTWSYPSDTFDGEVTVVQILGTWCPNCMDETRYFTELDEKYHFKGLNFIAVAFERPTDTARISEVLNSFVTDLEVNYPVAYGGVARKEVASAAFPMLTDFKSYPTCIILDKKGQVRRVHTGFAGPGTGEYYEEYAAETEAFLVELMGE